MTRRIVHYDASVIGVAELRRLLQERGLAPRTSLGQNFLIDANLVRKLVDASGAGAEDLVLEVGPGAGALTEELLDRGCRVVACELDEGLADLLDDRFAERGAKFQLIRGDCLANKHTLNADVATALGDERFRLIANLPYNVASPLMLTLLLKHPTCESLWVTIQKEVADRIMAAPGGRDYGELSVMAQAMAETQRIATVPPSCFWPAPKVTSAMIGLVRRRAPLTQAPAALQAITHRLFTQRRKQLGSILKNEMRDKAWPGDVEPAMRPEQLSIAQLDALARVVAGVDSK